MASVTVKNIPDDLYQRLQQAAHAHDRSIDSELIVCLQKALLPRTITSNERIVAAQALRKRVNATLLNVGDIDAARHAGRP